MRAHTSNVVFVKHTSNVMFAQQSGAASHGSLKRGRDDAFGPGGSGAASGAGAPRAPMRRRVDGY